MGSNIFVQIPRPRGGYTEYRNFSTSALSAQHKQSDIARVYIVQARTEYRRNEIHFRFSICRRNERKTRAILARNSRNVCVFFKFIFYFLYTYFFNLRYRLFVDRDCTNDCPSAPQSEAQKSPGERDKIEIIKRAFYFILFLFFNLQQRDFPYKSRINPNHCFHNRQNGWNAISESRA